jgi:hypothetical protein
MSTPVIFSQGLANSLTKISLVNFFHAIQSQFYPTQDISFMDFFLELTEHEGEFCVNHDKLVEYGVMTSDRSSAMKGKLEQLGLVEDVDFELQDILQLRNQGGTSTSKVYHLTPGAFKLCLMRARRYTGQSVDPVVYVQYYILLEKVFKLFTDYEKAYLSKLNSMKDDKIDSLERKIDEEREEAKARFEATVKHHEAVMAQFGIALTDREAKHSETIAELHLTQVKVDNANQQLDHMSYTLDEVVTVMQDTARHVAPVPLKSSRDPVITLVSRCVKDKDGNVVISMPIIRGQRAYARDEATKYLSGLSKRVVGKMKGDHPLNSRYQLAIPLVSIPDQTNLVDIAKRKFKALCDQKISDHNDPILLEIAERSRDVKQNVRQIIKLTKRNVKLNEQLSRTVNSTKADAWRAELAENDSLIETHQDVIATFNDRIDELNAIELYSKREICVKFDMTSVRYRSNRIVTYVEFMSVFIETVIETRNSMFSRQDIEELNAIANEQHVHLIEELRDDEEASQLALTIGHTYNEFTRQIIAGVTEGVFEDDE